MSAPATLYYAYDPMCSWCWAYRPVLDQIRNALAGKLPIVELLGGLAADSDVAMSASMQEKIIATWQRIHASLGTEFNFDFWQKNIPRRSTYPSCRAVIAAANQHAAQAMLFAIQQAYYLRAMNPSDDDVLLQLADELGLDFSRFMTDLTAQQTEDELQRQLSLARTIGADSFPSWIFWDGEYYHPVPIDYESPHSTLAAITELRGQGLSESD